MLALRLRNDALMPRLLRLDAVPTLVVLAITAVLLMVFTGPLCSDVSGQFWYARSLRHGTRLYTDIVEINPPLWFWMAIPLDNLAETLGIRAWPLVIATVGGLVVLAVGATGRLLNDMAQLQRVGLLVYIGLILLIMPALHLEQREHLVLIASVPYLVLATRRVRGQQVDRSLAIAIGIAAGLMFALKHYFLGVPVLLEIWLMLTLGRTWRPFRPETLALACTGLIYGIAFVVLAPSYFTNIVPMLSLAYVPLGPKFYQLFGPVEWIWGMMLVGFASQWRLIGSQRTPLTVAFLIGATGFALAWAIQHKGWVYQGVPTSGCLALALASLLIEAGPRIGRRFGLIVPALLALPLSFCVLSTEATITPANDIAPALADLKSGDRFALVSTIGATSWPATIDRRLRLSSRYGQYWMLDALDAAPQNQQVQAFGRTVVSQTAFDYRCNPPKVVVFVRFDHIRPFDHRIVINPSGYFLRNPEFAAVMSHYRLWRSGRIYDAYVPSSPLPPVDRRLCGRGI